ETPKVFIVRGAEHALSVGVDPVKEDGDALPFGPFDPEKHATMEKGLRSWVETQTPLTPGYVEQLYTFGSKNRYMGERQDNVRVVSVGYLALTHLQGADTNDHVFWGNWYDFFPWEDWRDGQPKVLHDV